MSRAVGARERLIQIMADKGVGQSELARRLGEKPNWVNRRVNPHPKLGNKADIAADEIPRLAAALGVPCMAFFDVSECPEVVQPSTVLSPADAGYATQELRRMWSGLSSEERAHLRPSVTQTIQALEQLLQQLQSTLETPPAGEHHNHA